MANTVTTRKKDSARLVWDTKPRRAPNPRDIEFQTAEVVIPNWQRDSGQIPMSFRDSIFGESEIEKQEMNRLIWGDNLLAMQALLAQGYDGKIALIYIDPPFASDEKYNFQTKIEVANMGDVPKQIGPIERLAYKDTWAGGTDSYLDMLYPRLQLMKRLLAEDGNLFLHLDWRKLHYVRILLDEVFGESNLVGEIIWQHQIMGGAHGRRFPKAHETILWYARSEKYQFHDKDPKVRVPFSEYVRQSMQQDEQGRWFYTRRRMSRKATADELARKAHTLTYVEDPGLGTLATDVWSDMPSYQPLPKDYTGFDTQKPTELIERIVVAGSAKGALVADFFCGSGTTLVVAERLGRRWIGCDLSKVAIQVARTRLVQQDAKPFLIENIGNYQREMIYLSGGRIGEMQRVILKLYGANPRQGSPDLGTRHNPQDGVLELVHVGYPDRPVTARKAEELARQAEKLDGTGYKRLVILAWDYDYNYSSELENRLRAAKQPIKTKIESRTIPPDIYDYLKKAKDEDEVEPLRGKIQFHEKPYLRLSKPEVRPLVKDKAEVVIGIERYVVFDLPVAEKEREKLQALMKDNFAVLIDYWAVDWDYDGYTFKSQWQDLRGNGRKTKVVTTQARTELPAGKSYTIAVRLVDIFGNDAAGTVEVRP